MNGSRAAYLYTLSHGARSTWRVYEALLQGELGEGVAQLAYIDDQGRLRSIVELHLTKQNSAHAWVRAAELPMLAASIEHDYEQRGLWKEALDDVRRFMAPSPSPSGEIPSATEPEP